MLDQVTSWVKQGDRLLIAAEGPATGEESLALLVNEAGYYLPPLPNLFFTRDAAAVIGESVMIAAMKHEVRWTEELIMRALFTYHPELGGASLVYDGTSERRMNSSIEGGDVHVLRHDLLLLGLSERTSASGIDALARRLFEGTEVRDLLVVLLPQGAYYASVRHRDAHPVALVAVRVGVHEVATELADVEDGRGVVAPHVVPERAGAAFLPVRSPPLPRTPW